MSALRRIGTSAALFGILGALWMMTAPAALADGFDNIAPHDTHGISIFDYPLSFNTGGGVLGLVVNPNVTGAAVFVFIMYGLYIFCSWLAFTLLNILVLVDWLSPLVKTINSISTNLYNQYGWKFITTFVFGTMLLTAAGYGLRNKSQSAWRHVGTTVVVMGVLAAFAFPVAWAARMLGIGRDIALETGASTTGQRYDSGNPTGPLIDYFVRRTVQRWTFGHDLDSLGCGDAWDAKIRAGDPDKVKDAAWSCPAGTTPDTTPKALHDHAMNPVAAIPETFLYTAFGVFILILIGVAVYKIFGVSVGALIHMGLIKIAAPFAGTRVGQWFIARNVIDGTLAGAITGGYLLALFIAASVAKVVAEVVPSSIYGTVITMLIIGGFIAGIKRSSHTLREFMNRMATQFASGNNGAAPAGVASGGGSTGRLLMKAAVGGYAAKRISRIAKRGGKAAWTAVSPQTSAAASFTSRVKNAGRSVQGRNKSAAAAHATSQASMSGQAPAAPQTMPTGAGGGYGYGLFIPTGAGSARIAAQQFRQHRAAQAQSPRVAGRYGRSSPPASPTPAPAGRNYATATAGASARAGAAPAGRHASSTPTPTNTPGPTPGGTPRTMPPATPPRPGGSSSSTRNTARDFRNHRRS